MIQAKTYCEVCMTGHYGNCPKLKATLTVSSNSEHMIVTPPKPTTQPSTELEEQLGILLADISNNGSGKYCAAHGEGQHCCIDKGSEAYSDITKAILTLIEDEVTKARILGVTFAKNHFQDFCNEEPHQILDEYIAELQGLSNKEKGTV